jgi:hypothetical protein
MVPPHQIGGLYGTVQAAEEISSERNYSSELHMAGFSSDKEAECDLKEA